MININVENRVAIIMAAQEIMDTTGQLWVTIGDDDVYIPELINELQELLKKETD